MALILATNFEFSFFLKINICLMTVTPQIWPVWQNPNQERTNHSAQTALPYNNSLY